MLLSVEGFVLKVLIKEIIKHESFLQRMSWYIILLTTIKLSQKAWKVWSIQGFALQLVQGRKKTSSKQGTENI